MKTKTRIVTYSADKPSKKEENILIFSAKQIIDAVRALCWKLIIKIRRKGIKFLFSSFFCRRC